MADAYDDQDGFDEAFDGFGEDPKQPKMTETPPAEGTPTPPAPEAPKVEEPKKDEQPAPEQPKKEEGNPPSPDGTPKTEENPQPPKTPEAAPAATEEPKPLTKDDVTSIIRDLQTTERTSGKELEATTNEVMEAYYPGGLSNVLTDERTGKELRTPQDVVEASNGEMSIEDAAQWLMNEQFKMDSEISKIKQQAQTIAETTMNFQRDSMMALQRYEPLFKQYPHLQSKTFDLLMKQTKVDQDKGVILSAPDVLDLYDTYLQPYQQAYEYATQQSATNPITPPTPTPGAEDRLDEGGDAGQTPPDDPNDFAQQTIKALERGI